MAGKMYGGLGSGGGGCVGREWRLIAVRKTLSQQKIPVRNVRYDL